MRALDATHWVFVVLAVACLVLAGERVWRAHREPRTLTQAAMILALGCLGVGMLANGLTPAFEAYANAGIAVFHTATGLLLGAVELIVLTLRVEHVPTRLVYRVVARAGFVSLVLTVTWLLGFATIGPVYALSDIHPASPALVIHLVVFHGYAVWALTQIVLLTWQRFPREAARRPASAARSCSWVPGPAATWGSTPWSGPSSSPPVRTGCVTS